MSALPEQRDPLSTTALDDLRSRLVVLNTRPVWLRWLKAGLHEVPAEREWREGRVAGIAQLAAELPYDQDIRLQSYNGYGINAQAWGITKWSGQDRMRDVSRPEPLKEARVTGSVLLDIGWGRELPIFNLLDLEQDHPYALPATDLAVMIRSETADLVHLPS